jgi:hypothetical protein
VGRALAKLRHLKPKLIAEPSRHEFLREADDDQVELLIGDRTYRVRRAEVRSA